MRVADDDRTAPAAIASLAVLATGGGALLAYVGAAAVVAARWLHRLELGERSLTHCPSTAGTERGDT